MAVNVLVFVMMSKIKYEILKLFRLIKRSVIEHEVKLLHSIQSDVLAEPQKYIRAYEFNIQEMDSYLEHAAKE